MKPAVQRNIFSVHAWFGLITGMFLLILGITGSILVFREEIHHAMYDHLVVPHVNRSKMPLDSIYRKLATRYEHTRGLALLSNPRAEDHAYEFRVYTSDDKLYTIDLFGVIVDPYTGNILREGFYRDFWSFPTNWIFSFHYSFMLGNPGMFVTAVFGLTMLISIVTGAIVYRKNLWKVLTFRVAVKRKNWRTISSDLHRVVGVWSLVLNVIIFFTGFWLNRFMFEPAGWKIKPPLENVYLAPYSLDDKLALAYDSIPGLQPTYISFPLKRDGEFSISGTSPDQSASRWIPYHVLFKSEDGTLLNIRKPEEVRGPLAWFNASYFSLHVGSFWGLPTRILYVILGLTPGLLSITGFMLWWRRERRSVALLHRQEPGTVNPT